MSDLPYMELWVKDFLADTVSLDDRQSWAYIAIIMEYWLNGRPPRNDDRELARIARQSLPTWRRIRPAIERFFERDEHGAFVSWRHKRVEAELEKARDKRKKRSSAGAEGGRRSAEKRKQNQRPPPSNAGSNAAASQRQQQHQPQNLPQAAQLPESPRARFCEADFDRIEQLLRRSANLENDPNPKLADLSPIVQLLSAGYDLERDVLPLVRAKRNGAKPRSWAYFVPAIMEARSRAAPAPAAVPPAETDEQRWRRLWQSWTKGFWHMQWGPRPDCAGCQIPLHLREQWAKAGAA